MTVLLGYRWWFTFYLARTTGWKPANTSRCSCTSRRSCRSRRWRPCITWLCWVSLCSHLWIWYPMFTVTTFSPFVSFPFPSILVLSKVRKDSSNSRLDTIITYAFHNFSGNFDLTNSKRQPCTSHKSNSQIFYSAAQKHCLIKKGLKTVNKKEEKPWGDSFR